MRLFGIVLVVAVIAVSRGYAADRSPYDGDVSRCWMGQDDVIYFYACGSRRAVVDPCSRGMNTNLSDCVKGKK